MGSDLHFEFQNRIDPRDAAAYARLRESLGELLNVRVRHHVGGPGVHEPSDDELLALLRQRLGIGVDFPEEFRKQLAGMLPPPLDEDGDGGVG